MPLRKCCPLNTITHSTKMSVSKSLFRFTKEKKLMSRQATFPPRNVKGKLSRLRQLTLPERDICQENSATKEAVFSCAEPRSGSVFRSCGYFSWFVLNNKRNRTWGAGACAWGAGPCAYFLWCLCGYVCNCKSKIKMSHQLDSEKSFYCLVKRSMSNF